MDGIGFLAKSLMGSMGVDPRAMMDQARLAMEQMQALALHFNSQLELLNTKSDAQDGMLRDALSSIEKLSEEIKDLRLCVATGGFKTGDIDAFMKEQLFDLVTLPVVEAGDHYRPAGHGAATALQIPDFNGTDYDGGPRL